MKRADAQRRAIVRKNNRLAFQKRMQQRANMLGAMSLAERRAKDEQKAYAGIAERSVRAKCTP